MSFPDPDKQPGDDRRIKIEFAVLLALTLLMLGAGARSAWDALAALL